MIQPPAMGNWSYSFARQLGRLVGVQTMVIKRLHADRFEQQPGGFVLACTHLSHLEPFIISGLMRRKIDWMARIEFYKYRLSARFLDAVDAFPVNRRGVPVKAIRAAINRATAGRIVGIFPEGGVVHGDDAIINGGPLKLGACTIAQRAQVPILPVVVIGTRQLTRIAPWMPFRHARLWVIFGQLVEPPPVGTPRRAGRFEMGERLQQEFLSACKELRRTMEIPDHHFPPRSFSGVPFDQAKMS